MGLRLDDADAPVQDAILLHEMIVELHNLFEDLLGVLVRLQRPLIGGPAEDLLADQNYKDEPRPIIWRTAESP